MTQPRRTRRIALLTQFFPPEPAAAANRMAAMSGALARAGNDVRVYTALPSFPDGRIFDGYPSGDGAIERHGPVSVERCRTYVGGLGRRGGRILHWLSVALDMTRRVVLARPGFDLIVVSSPPITLALPALAASFLRRTPLVVDIRDVFPDVAVQMGIWNAGSPVARIVGFVADRLYARAVLVTCVNEKAREEIAARGVPAEKIHLAVNGFDEVAPAAEPPYPSLQGVRDVVFVGNMGLATGLDVVLDAAALLAGDATIRFVLIGAGAEAARLRARAESERLTNVVFTGALAREKAFRALGDADATVIPLNPTVLNMMPTKMFDAMLVGVPMVVSAAGQAKSLVEQADAGLAVVPGDAAALVGALRRVLDDTELRERFARNGPAFVRANYDRAEVMRQLAARLASLLDRDGGRAPAE